MAAPSAARQSPTLEEFLRMPEIEEAPYLEYVEGRIEAKAMPTPNHNLIESGFTIRINGFARNFDLGVAIHELRHTFAGRSILPDVSFLKSKNLRFHPDGTLEDFIPTPPDVHIEVISPDQAVAKTHSKLLFSVANGCPLGIMVNPETKTIDVDRPGRTPERLTDDGVIDFTPVLPGLVIPVSEVFGWMIVCLKRPGVDPV